MAPGAVLPQAQSHLGRTCNNQDLIHITSFYDRSTTSVVARGFRRSNRGRDLKGGELWSLGVPISEVISSDVFKRFTGILLRKLVIQRFISPVANIYYFLPEALLPLITGASVDNALGHKRLSFDLFSAALPLHWQLLRPVTVPSMRCRLRRTSESRILQSLATTQKSSFERLVALPRAATQDMWTVFCRSLCACADRLRKRGPPTRPWKAQERDENRTQFPRRAG
ncbi:hypothetical protein EDB85DRAFT_1611804 [Lactarius pseudohatsudake]|nr:hypothetical protein EDB85DRAFT_1611804 [Lactarius pseudohatsudake]